MTRDHVFGHGTALTIDHVSGHGTALSVPGSQDHSRAARLKEDREREKEKAKDDPKVPEEHSLKMNRYKIPSEWSEEAFASCPKERKARKACQKATMVYRRVVFALTSPTKVQARTFPKTKAEERIKKENAKKEPFLNPDCQPQKNPMKKDKAAPRNQTIGLPVPQLGDWNLHGELHFG